MRQNDLLKTIVARIISIHAPRERCDDKVVIFKSLIKISIHAPRERCDLTHGLYPDAADRFQSTHRVSDATLLALDKDVYKRQGEFDHYDRTAGFVGLAGRCVVYLADENDEEDQCQSDPGGVDQYADAYGSGHAGDLCFLRLGVCRSKRRCAVRVGGVVAGRGHDERTFGNGDRRCDCPRGRPGSAAANKREDEKASWGMIVKMCIRDRSEGARQRGALRTGNVRRDFLRDAAEAVRQLIQPIDLCQGVAGGAAGGLWGDLYDAERGMDRNLADRVC